MDVFDQKAVLDSFRILVDTREQDTARARRRYKSFGCPFEKTTLNYGDYTYTATLPDGSSLVPSGTVSGLCVVERKMDLDELAQCLTRNRARFAREFERAAANGARVFLLVEDGSWEGIIAGRYKTRIHPNAFFSSLTAWMIRYNITIVFCKEETSGRMIREILYRDLKERLENGGL